ncbi:hypothetical protein C8Q75DRAFT_765133 [Abortiporus biennis]|nr:hypothetical protein C8Q75DRAFT_765133 [Abortiporus biennis]
MEEELEFAEDQNTGAEVPVEFFESGYTILNQSPTTTEWDWMDDMRNIYEVYEIGFTGRFTIPNPNLRSPRLPLEICILVLDYIGIEMIKAFTPNVRGVESLVRTMWSCCLSCHAFLDRSRSYLYRHVTPTSNWTVQSFLGITQRNAHLQGLTTHLVLNTTDVKAYHRILLHGQTVLSKLGSLRLTYMPILNPHVLRQCHRPFPSVTTLFLEFCTFSSVLDLRRLVDGFFSHLSPLEVLRLELSSSHVTLPKEWRRKTVFLSSLQIYDHSGAYGPIQQWLLSTPTQNSIRSLTITPPQTKMLLSFGHNIEELAISASVMYNGEYGPNESKHYSLSIGILHSCLTEYSSYLAISLGSHLLPKLKSLYILLWSDQITFQFCAMLSRCHPSPTLMKVALDLYGKISKNALSKLDNTLSLLPSQTQIELHPKLRNTFPELQKKRMLVSY